MTLSNSRRFLTALIAVVVFFPVLSYSQPAFADTSTIGDGNSDSATTIGGGTSATTQDSNCSSDAGTIVNPLKVCSLTALLDTILNAVITLGGIILTIALIWTGLKFVAARGNAEKIQSARTALLWTIIGGLILLGAKGIETVIQSTVNAL